MASIGYEPIVADELAAQLEARKNKGAFCQVM